MTISAQVPDRANINSSLAERPTHGLSSRHPFVVDSFALLDHRTRDRALSAGAAAPGRYLSFEHDGKTLLIALERPITHIGRGLVADVRLEDSHVSRRHAILALRGEGARVLDDRSSNGTFVNGRAVTVAELSDGDVLRFGRAVFRYTEIAPRGRARPLRRIPLARSAHRGEPAGAAA
jgi:pSer/pThr/pTyr-binding forkhead associated (FHA) protein